MNLKQFDYSINNVGMLKKDIFLRLMFSVLFVGVFVWQLYDMIYLSTTSTLSDWRLIVGILVLVTSFFMIVCGILYAKRSSQIIKTIKSTGRCVSSVSVLFSTNKTGFMKLYKIVNLIFSVLILLVLVAATTHSILRYNYFNSVSYYFPILVCTCIASFHATYQVGLEIKTMEIVNETHGF